MGGYGPTDSWRLLCVVATTAGAVRQAAYAACAGRVAAAPDGLAVALRGGTGFMCVGGPSRPGDFQQRSVGGC